MRMDSATLGTGVGALIIGALIGVFVIPHCVCNTDGNPVGFHAGGYVKLDQKITDLGSCSNAQACYLQIDMTFDPAAAPKSTPTPCATGQTGCFSFSNVPPEPLQSTWVAIDYGHPGDPTPYTNYFYGVIQGALKEPSGLRPPARRPSAPH